MSIAPNRFFYCGRWQTQVGADRIHIVSPSAEAIIDSVLEPVEAHVHGAGAATRLRLTTCKMVDVLGFEGDRRPVRRARPSDGGLGGK